MSQKVSLNLLKKEIRHIFKTYDKDKSNCLDKQEMRVLVDEIRIKLYLPKSDDNIFQRIFTHLDKDRDGILTLKEFRRGLKEIYPIISEPGEEQEKVIRAEFEDYDFDDAGYLEVETLMPLFNKICDRVGLPNCQKWQVDYIINLMDNNGDGKLSQEELISNYTYGF